MAEAESIEEGRKATKQIEAGNLVSAPSFEKASRNHPLYSHPFAPEARL